MSSFPREPLSTQQQEFVRHRLCLTHDLVNAPLVVYRVQLGNDRFGRFKGRHLPLVTYRGDERGLVRALPLFQLHSF
jgi:hypothetical protein